MAFTDRLVHAWNAFMNKDPTYKSAFSSGGGNYLRPDRPRLSRGNERSMVTSIYNRIAVDCAAIDIEHVRLDKDGRYKETLDSSLNSCLNLEANLDQTGRAFRQDIVLSMFNEGCIAVAPIDTEDDPTINGAFKIDSMRTGKIVQWYPNRVLIDLYNERTGMHEEVMFLKRTTAIIENPFYAVMNEPNSTLQRLIRKLNLLDAIDEQSGSGKLDLLIQLPYSVKSETRRQQAERRRKDIETQLTGSKYGIAYIDATEHVTQLNRAVENNLLNQIEYLTSMLYSQLGLTKEIMDGSADEKTLNNYYSRTVEPILSAIVDEMKRKFLSKTARSQGQSIMFFRDPFKLIPISSLAEIADKMTRNEIMTSNEVRQGMGMKPSGDPNADVLRNKNLNQSTEEMPGMTEDVDVESQLADLDDLDSQLDELEDMVNE